MSDRPRFPRKPDDPPWRCSLVQGELADPSMPEASTSRCQKDPSCKASGSKDQGCLVFLDLQAQAQKEARMLDHKTRTPEASLPLRLRNTQTHAFPCSPGPGLALISYLGSPQDGDRPFPFTYLITPSLFSFLYILDKNMPQGFGAKKAGAYGAL